MSLKIAIQKSGRLHEDSIKLLNDCGIGVKNGSSHLKSVADNFPLEAYFLRDDDIPQYVEDGVAHVGIVGENVVFEKNKAVDVVEQLGFSNKLYSAFMLIRFVIFMRPPRPNANTSLLSLAVGTKL